MAEKKGVKVPVEVEPKVSETASQKAVKDIEKVKKQASAKPVEIQVKLDDSKMVESFNLIARNISDALKKLQDQINRTFAGFHGTNNGFAEINKEISKTGVSFSSFEQSISHIENDIRLMSGAFKQLGDGSTEIGGLTSVFERIGTEIGRVVSNLSTMTKMLSSINEKMNIDATRPLAIIKQDAENAEAKIVKLKQELASIGDKQLQGKTFDYEKYFNRPSVQKLISRVFSAQDMDKIPTAGLNKLQKSIANIFTLPPDVIKNYKVQIGEIEYTLEELAKKFAQVSLKLSKGEDNFLQFDGRKQINQIRATEQEIVKLTEESKVAREYLNRGFNVQIDPSSIEALVTAMSSISELTAHLGEGTTLGIDPAQIESVVNAFTELKGILFDIYNLLNKSDIFGANTHIATDEINRINQALEATEVEAQKAKVALKNAIDASVMADGGSALNLLDVLHNEVIATEEIEKAQQSYNESVKQSTELVKQEETELQKLARLAFNRDTHQTIVQGNVSGDWMMKANESAEIAYRISEISAACMDVGKSSQVMKQQLQDAIRASKSADAGNGIEVWASELENASRLIEEQLATTLNDAKARLEAARQALIDFANSGKAVADHVKEYEALQEEYKNAERALSLLTNKEKTEASILKELAQEYNQVTKASSSSAAKAEADAQKRIKAIQAGINKLDTYVLKLKESGEAELVGERFSRWFGQFDQFKKGINFDGISSAGLDRFESQLKRLQDGTIGMGEAVKIAKKNIDGLASDSKISTLTRQMERFINPDINPRLSTETINKVREYINSLTPGQTTISQLNQVRQKFSDIQIAAAKAGETGANWFDGWKKRLASLTQYLTTFVSFYRIVGYVREAFNTINELDYALVDLRKTTAMTNDELNEFYYNSVNVGKAVGTTAKEIINQAAAWSRLGYQTKEEATAMAELSAQFAAISPGMDLDKATDGLVSTMKAFHIDVENVEQEVMDSINRVGKQKMPKHTVMYGAIKLIA